MTGERWPANGLSTLLSVWPSITGTCRHLFSLIGDQLVIKTWVQGALHMHTIDPKALQSLVLQSLDSNFNKTTIPA